MSNNLADVWFEVENLLNQNISVVPVRDKDTIHNGKLYAAKTPYKEWKKYQYEIIDRAVLFQEMQEKDTTAIAMICGAISGNLEVIDFDVKYYPGIDATVINAINEFYPDIIAKMRVHKTRSGGTHLVYRINEHEVPPSTHLAERAATPEEIALNPKGKKTRCYIETRGTGGMATAPPSLGYVIRKNIPVQTITWEERCSIIELCRAYNEYTPDEKPYKPPASEASYYDENPFEHYNRTIDPVELFTTYGWVYVKKHGDYIWFTRPGGRKGDVHAGFNLKSRCYRVWGTKADLDSERSYTPSTILAHYAFNDDKSLVYAHLVQQGYGRIKPSMERTMAKRKALQGIPMPTNASPEAVAVYTQLVEQLHTAHPHGIYWEVDDEHDGDIKISRLGFKEVATKMGFRVYRDELVQIVEQFIYRRDLRYFFDCMRAYIKEEDADLYESIYNSTQLFLEKHGKFESTQLDFLDESTVLNDTRTACYKFYLNGYVHITPQGYSLVNYDTITDKLIWHEKIQQRAFNMATNTNSASDGEPVNDGGQHTFNGLYSSFLELACDLSNNRDHIMRTIGWLAHDYKDTTTGYIVTLTEKCADPKDGGGSGKNLFCQLLEHTTTVLTVAAAQKRMDNSINLLQSWNNEKLFVLSDPKKDFDFEVLKEPSAGNATVKKLFKDERNVKCADLPKFIVPTNFSYDVSDGGLRRRIIAIEFTNFFTLSGGVDGHFGKLFPTDWGEEDWADYDNFICNCIQTWMAGGLKLTPIQLEGTGWEKQFIFTYGQTLFDFYNENWEQWKRDGFVTNIEFNKKLDDFLLENNIHQRFKPTGIKINKALDEWCKKNGWHMDRNEVRRVELSIERGRKFYEEAPF